MIEKNLKKGVSIIFVTILCIMVLPFPRIGLGNGSGSDWPMHRHDVNRSGYTSVIGPKYNFTKWTFQTGAPVLPSPAVVDGVVYVGSNDSNVYALNMLTGSKIWNYSTGPGGIHTSPAVANGIVYIGANDNRTYALNATTGAQIWNFTAYGTVYLNLSSPFWSSPIAVNGIVYIGNQDSVVYALNATTGAVVWAQTVYGACTGSSPAVVGGRLYIGTAGYLDPYPGNVTCLNATTGALIWNYTLTPGVYFSSPAVVGGVVYVGTFGGFVLALNATDGRLLSSFLANPIPVNTSPAVANGFVYVGSGDGKIYALDASNLATVRWSKTIAITSYPFGGVYSSPVVAGDAVYVGTDDGTMFALDAITGAEIWTYQTGGRIRGSSAVVSGSPSYPSLLYMGAYDGKIYAIYDVYHDVAVTTAIPLKTIVGQAFTCRINASITNQGNRTETFNVTAYADANIISKLVGVTLESQASTNLTFVWNTSGFPKGNYTLKVGADTVRGETDTLDNNFTDGWIIVAMVGDLTGNNGYPDGKVNMEDVGNVARLFGVNYPDPRYNPNYDINDDTRINMEDIGTVARHFGQTDP